MDMFQFSDVPQTLPLRHLQGSQWKGLQSWDFIYFFFDKNSPLEILFYFLNFLISNVQVLIIVCWYVPINYVSRRCNNVSNSCSDAGKCWLNVNIASFCFLPEATVFVLYESVKELFHQDVFLQRFKHVLRLP